VTDIKGWAQNFFPKLLVMSDHVAACIPEFVLFLRFLHVAVNTTLRGFVIMARRGFKKPHHGSVL
jgi:hypothetical protein